VSRAVRGELAWVRGELTSVREELAAEGQARGALVREVSEHAAMCDWGAVVPYWGAVVCLRQRLPAAAAPTAP
jgi:hypothetical protein